MKLLHWGLFATVVLVIVFAATFGPYPVSVLSGSHAQAVRPVVQAVSPSAALDTSVEPSFDYFPNHYRNHAKEPAEPVDTF
jgi:hypothetical protein